MADIPPAFQSALLGLARVASKAIATGLESVLEDAEGLLNAGAARVKTARAKARKIAQTPPPRAPHSRPFYEDSDNEE